MINPSIWPGRIEKDIDGCGVTIPIQSFYLPAPDDFNEATKPSLWLTTFLAWHPSRIEGVWKTTTGSVWTPDLASRMLPIQRIDVTRQVSLSYQMFLAEKTPTKWFLFDLLKDMDALTIHTPPRGKCTGSVSLSSVDQTKIETILSKFDCPICRGELDINSCLHY